MLTEGLPAPPTLQLRNISKAFAGVAALQKVDFNLQAGEVHALVGENGAGKSTLMKILFGLEQPDEGEIMLADKGAVWIGSPRHALALGIGLVSQELSLVPQLDVAQNIFLGQGSGLIKRRELQARARQILRPLAPQLAVTVRVSTLGMAARQVVEIARTLARGGQIIAFDEPTSSLTPLERDGLFAIIKELRRSGKSIIYISHRIPEIYAIADRITVLRDGRVVARRQPAEVSSDELFRLIVGRQLAQELPAQRLEGQPGENDGDEVLSVEELSVRGKLHGISLSLRSGEIFGLAGLVGSGRTELARCIFGADPRDTGAIVVDGRAIDIRRPADAQAAGIALIPEDRRGQALVPVMDVERNFGLANYRFYSRYGWLRLKQRLRDTLRYIDEMAIRPPRSNISVRGLSGGNQQKVVIARWLKSEAKIFLFDEPTRGIDVGAKAEIHRLLRRLADEGRAILVISSELPELLMICDRIGVMREGRLLGTLDSLSDMTTAVTEETLMKYATGEFTLA